MTKLLNIKGMVALVAVNEAFSNLLIEDILLDNGCAVLGPYLSYEDAFHAAEVAEFDIGILSATLKGMETYAVAELLSRRE